MKTPFTVLGSPVFWLLVLSHVVVFALGARFHQLMPWAGDLPGFAEGIAIRGIIASLTAWHALGALIVAGLVLLIVRIRSRLALVLGVLGFVYIFFWGLWLVSDRMTGVGINQSVVFHLFSGTHGADYSQFGTEIALAVGFFALAVALLALALGVGWRSGKATRHSLSLGNARHRRPSGVAVPLVLGCLLVGAGWLTSPWHRDILDLANSYARLNGDDEKRLQALYAGEPRAVGTDKNLVVLYLESVESTYFDEDLFPGLLPNLRRLREASTYFTGIAQTPGAGWTIAGLVNTQCGVPLATPGPDVNDMGRVRQFLPKAKCLAEHLADNGFRTVYLGGASGEFAGKGRFLEQHGFADVRDKTYFQTRRGASADDVAGWGAYDDELLDSAYREFVELSQKGEPFALFALTMDTHHPHGHISPSCDGMNYGDGSLKTLNALRCADQLVGRFIQAIRTSPHYANTTLVVLSDHLAMVNDAKHLVDKAVKRENLLMIFDSALAAGERHVEGSMVDVGASLLDLLGAEDTRLGFGRSLLAPRDGSSAAYSAAYHASGDVTDYLGFARGLWDMPSVVGRIRSDGNGSVVLGGNLMDAPFFSVLDSQNQVVELYFYDFARRIDELKEGGRYLYALECEESRHAVAGVCLVSGLKGVGEKVFSPSELLDGVRAADIL